MTFGPLPSAAGPTLRRPSPRLRRRAVPGARDCLALAALWLDYPDDGLVARRADLLATAWALPPSRPARRLVEFGQWFAAADPARLRVDYVETFDHRRRAALYVTFARAGDSRRRGVALLAFQRLYADWGYRAREDELPDYLPTVLQFAALAPAEASATALAWARPGVEQIAGGLVAAKSPWAPLLAAVEGCLPDPDPTADFWAIAGQPGALEEQVAVCAAAEREGLRR